MQNRTDMVGVSLWDRLGQLAASHKKWMGMGCAAASGFVMANSSIFGGVAPFGVAFCASLQGGYAMSAALGAVLGYTFTAVPLTNMKYIAAILLAITFKWLTGGKLDAKRPTLAAAATCFVALSISSTAVILTMDYTLYDVVLSFAEVFLGCGGAYFFSRTLGALKLGWAGASRSDISCIVISFAIVVMGFASIRAGSLSVGRLLCVLIILLCARYGAEAGGAVAGITAGIAMGLAGGDYAYVMAAYGFGGLLAGVFGNLGRIATASSFIVINAVLALFTKQGGDIYTSIFEIFIATVLFIAIPSSWANKLKLNQLLRPRQQDLSAQNALRDRLSDISVALTDISHTTHKVSEHLGKLEGTSIATVYNRVSDRVCQDCGLKTTCWQFKYSDTMNAMNSAISILKREGSISRQQVPKYFTDSCCRLDDFLAELNSQFHDYVSKEGVQLKVSKVRSVVTDQFEGMAMMIDEISTELCGLRTQDARKAARVAEYFDKEKIPVQQVLCYTDEFDRMSVEIMLLTPLLDQLHKTKATLDLCMLLEADFDLPQITTRTQYTTVTFTEKATFTAELGAYQIASGNNRLCGDAYDYIRNRGGKTHLILSDGMGSGGNAAVDSSMASGLITRLLSVGISHTAALKMVNSALLIKSGEESLATIDIACLDLFTGRAEFYKAGAAPTFILRGGKAGYVESTSLPAGILRGVAFEKSAVTLHEGDVVVLISDGVIATGTDWVKSELEALRACDMQRLCEKLAMTAKMRRNDGHEDDITVVAAALRRGA